MDWESFYARFREPDFVPGYEIQDRLGSGAFGEVYRARKASIGKSYAIKFLKVDGEDQRAAALRELEQVRHFATIDHPNLVTIEDLGSAGGVPYLVMGYAGEDTLARRLRAGALDERGALACFAQVCRGVQALHERSLVHFDLKPGNVFLKGDAARVGDYGLSRLMTGGRATLSFGRGTPHYMAPEMLKSRADYRADVYSLGAILYECLAGKPPYEPTVPGAIAVREDDLPPQFPGRFPERMRPIVVRCLRLEPADRYTSVTELLADLERAGGGSSAPLPPQADRRFASSTERKGSVRVAAAELTRGAAELARGAWDGLRRPELLARSDALVIQTLSEDALPRLDSGAPAPRTIPVPPSVSGGWFGTVFATIALSIEVFFVLVRWLARGPRMLKKRDARAAKPPSLAWRIVLGVGVVLGFMLLGALVALLVWALLRPGEAA